MKSVITPCPHCGEQITLDQDRKYFTCPQCERRLSIRTGVARSTEGSFDLENRRLEAMKMSVVRKDIDLSVKLSREFFSNGETQCHGWMLKASVQLLGMDFNNEKDTPFPHYLEGNARFEKAEESWGYAFSLLEDQYCLHDFSVAVGLSVAVILPGEDEKKKIDATYVIDMLNRVGDLISEKLGIEYKSDFLQRVSQGMISVYKDKKPESEMIDLIRRVFSEGLRCETDPDTFIAKCNRFIEDAQAFGDDYITDNNYCSVGVLSHIVTTYRNNLSDDEMPMWTETALRNDTRDEWGRILSSWKRFQSGDIEEMSYKELVLLANESVRNYGKTDENEKPAAKEPEVHDEPMRIVEEEQTFKQRMKKERTFRQYLTVDGHRFSRAISASRNEFDGSLDNPEDLEKLNALFEEAFGNVDDPYGEYDDEGEPEGEEANRVDGGTDASEEMVTAAIEFARKYLWVE